MGAASSSFPGVTPVPGGEIACVVTGAFKSAREFRIIVILRRVSVAIKPIYEEVGFSSAKLSFLSLSAALPRKMQARGLPFGSVDACHPSRVVQGRF
jgi:hypothetical protein